MAKDFREFSVQKAVAPAVSTAVITDTNTTHAGSRSVYIGIADDYDFYVDGSWVTFKNTIDGSVLPIMATGARHNSGSTAPDSGDVIFLY